MSFGLMKANQLFKQAESKSKSIISFGPNKYKDAIEMYDEASDLFSEEHLYSEAAKCNLAIAKCSLALKKPLEAAEAYADAGMNFYNDRKVDEAIENYETAARMFSENGKFVKAAETHLELADIFEKDHKLKLAANQVQKAADYYEAENKNSTNKRIVERLAHLNARAGYYEEAIEFFESTAGSIIRDGTDSKIKAREYLFKAGLCHLAQVEDPDEDLEMAEDAIKGYKNMDKYFARSCGHQLLDGIMDALDEKSIPLYQKAMRDYDDNDGAMDLWTTAILEVIYGRIKFISDEENDLT